MAESTDDIEASVALSVRCPQCFANPGEKCTWTSPRAGGLTSPFHYARRTASGVTVRYPPSRSQELALTVECPEPKCQAAVGEQCWDLRATSGRFHIKSPHGFREVMAAEAKP